MDLGFGLGGDSRYFLDMGFQVVAIEANPMALDRARPMFSKELLSGDLILIGAAISASPGFISFHAAERLEMSRTTIPEGHPDTMEVFTVPATTCSALFDVFGTPTYLKVDIEEDSSLCLESLHRSNATPPKYFSIELEAGDLLKHFIRLLSLMGYSQFVGNICIPRLDVSRISR
eukprot:GEMP01034562.1.p1 GENE.GEMP01034562.1~~GEMP01034562.1.p1  ORF type:complete len:175 (+),score=38.80 GEMP01034562.1:649-1173(+)